MRRHRLVLDTNILISGILFIGPPRKVLELCISGQVKCFISDHILKELVNVLQRPKFGFSFEQTIAIAEELQSTFTLLKPDISIDAVSADPDDNRILECAVKANADFIVSGDSHLLDMKQFHGIKILSAREYLKQYKI